MQSLQPVRERKINKAHREYVTNDNAMDISIDNLSVPVDKKKTNHINNVERKRKRISAQNEIVIPKLEEKFKISSNSSQKKISNELTESSPVTKPKKYYDQAEIRKYMKEKRISRKKSQEELDQVVPEKPKPKSYNVNEVRDFMRKRLKAREEQHKKEIEEKEKKSNEIKQRLEKLREFQRKQRNIDSSNKLNSKSKEKSNKIKGKEPFVQKDNYLKSSVNKSDVVVVNKFHDNNDVNMSTMDSSGINDNSFNTYSYLDNSEYENIPTKLTNTSYDELSKIINNTDVTDSSNYNEDYSIESLQSQAKRIQELIKNAESLAQRIEQHTSKMPKSKENNVNIINSSSITQEKPSKIKSYSSSIHDSISSSSSSSSYHNFPVSSSYHQSNISTYTDDVASIPQNYKMSYQSSHSDQRSPELQQTPIMESSSSKGKNELSSINDYSKEISTENSQHSNNQLTSHYDEISNNNSSRSTSSKNKLKEKDPYYSQEESISYNSSSPIHHEESWSKDKMSMEDSIDFHLSTDSEIKIENLENITPSQWKIEINPPAKTGDNYSTINIFTRRFHPTQKENIKNKSDSSNIYKKIVKKMEENNQDNQTSTTILDDKDKVSTITSTELNDTMDVSEKLTYNESNHSSSPPTKNYQYSDDFTSISNYNSMDDSSHSSDYYYSSTTDNNHTYQQPPQSTNYEHVYIPQPQYYPQPQMHSIHPMNPSINENNKEAEGRLSPHFLSRKLMSEINYLETLNESNIQLEKMNNERNSVRTEQEMATVLQALILKQKKHEMDIENAEKFRKEQLRNIGVQALPEEQLRNIGIQALPETYDKGILAEEPNNNLKLKSISTSMHNDPYEDSFEEFSDKNKSEELIPSLLSEHDKTMKKDSQLISNLDDSNSSSLQMKEPVSRFHRNDFSSYSSSVTKDSEISEEIPIQENSSDTSTIKENLPYNSKSISQDSSIQEDIPENINKSSTSTNEISEDIHVSYSDSNNQNKSSKDESIIEEDISFVSVKNQDSSNNMAISPRYSSPKSIKSEEDLRRISRYLEKEKYPKNTRDRSRSRSRSRSPTPSQHSTNNYYDSMDSFESYHGQDDKKQIEDNDLTSTSSSLKSINDKIELVKSKLLDDHLEKKEYRLSLSKEIAENLLKKRQKAIKWEEKLKKEEKEIKDILDKALNMQARSSTVSSASSSYVLSNDNDYLDSQYRMKEENKRKTTQYVNSPLSNMPFKSEPEDVSGEIGEIENDDNKNSSIEDYMGDDDKNKNSSIEDYMEDDEAEDEEIIEENFKNSHSSSFDKYKSEEEIIEEMIEQSTPITKSDSIIEEIPDYENNKSSTQSIEELIESKIASDPSVSMAVDDYNSNSFENVTDSMSKLNSSSNSKIGTNSFKLNTKSKSEDKKNIYSEILENDLKTTNISDSILSNEDDLDEEENKLKERINLLKIQIDKQKNVAKQLFLEKKKQRQLIHQKLLEKEMHFRKQLDRINAIVKKTENELNEIMKGGSVVSTPDVSILQEQDQQTPEQLTEISEKQSYSADSKMGEIISIASADNSVSQYQYTDSFESDNNDTSESISKKDENEQSTIKESISEDNSKSTIKESIKESSQNEESIPSDIIMEDSIKNESPEIKIEVTLDKEPQSEIQVKIHVDNDKDISEHKDSLPIEESIEESIQTEIEESIKEESIKEESIKEESIKDESIKDESIKEESIKKESIKEESIKEESIKKESIKDESIKEESIKEESIKKESIKDESIKEESIKEESIKKESIKDESIKEESIKEESIKKESIKDESIKEESIKESIEESIKESIEESIKENIEESIKNESIKEESVKEDSIKEESIKEESLKEKSSKIEENISEPVELVQSESQEGKEGEKETSDQKESIPSEIPIEENIEEFISSDIQIEEEIQDISESSQSDIKSSIIEGQNESKIEKEIQSDIEMVDANVVENIEAPLSDVQVEEEITNNKSLNEDIQDYSEDFIEEESIKSSSKIYYSQTEKEQPTSEKLSVMQEDEKQSEEKEDSLNIEEEIKEDIEEEIIESIDEQPTESKSSTEESKIVNTTEQKSPSVSDNVENEYSNTFIDEDQIKSITEDEEIEEDISEVIDEDIKESIENEDNSLTKSSKEIDSDKKEIDIKSENISEENVENPPSEKVISEISEESEKKDEIEQQVSSVKEIPQEELSEESKEESIVEEVIEEDNSSIGKESISEKEPVSVVDLENNNDIEDALAILQEASDIIKKDWNNSKEIQMENEEEHEKEEIISDVTQQIFNDLLTDTMNSKYFIYII